MLERVLFTDENPSSQKRCRDSQQLSCGQYCWDKNLWELGGLRSKTLRRSPTGEAQTPYFLLENRAIFEYFPSISQTMMEKRHGGLAELG